MADKELMTGMLKIKLLTFRDAPASERAEAPGRIEKFIPADSYRIVENEDPDVLFFLTGGSERSAVSSVKDGGFYILVGSMCGNAYASATEVKSYLNDRNIKSVLTGEEEESTEALLRNLIKVKSAFERLKGQRVGLIGSVSEWLVNSAVTADVLKETLGLKLVEIQWNNLKHFSEYGVSDEIIECFSGNGVGNLSDTARVSGLLSYVLREYNLDAITVECFPLVQKEGVTACLPLAKFNDEGIPAGCEGDLTAIAGMMVCKELTGIIPWMANVNRVTDEICMFSHCTAAPGLLSGFNVTTHYETGKGTAIAGRFNSETVTIFRFDNQLKRAFIAVAPVTGRPEVPTACRTQIEVKLSARDVRVLKESPLGNHHLIFPGDCEKILILASELLGAKVINLPDLS
jgi:L-fucose isomerase-like protein